MDWLTQYQVVLRAREYERHDRTELETEVRISLATGARWSEGEELKKFRSRNTKSHTPTRKAEKTAPSQSAKNSMSLCLMIEKVGCLVIVMAHSDQLWKEQASNYRQGNLPTFYATPSPATL